MIQSLYTFWRWGRLRKAWLGYEYAASARRCRAALLGLADGAFMVGSVGGRGSGIITRDPFALVAHAGGFQSSLECLHRALSRGRHVSARQRGDRFVR